jgi:hypothetical protein
MLSFGAVSVLSADGWLRNRARGDLHLAPVPASVDVAVPRLRNLCGRGQKCGLTADGHCTRLAGCPVFPVQETLPSRLREELDRRVVLAGGAAAAGVGLFALLLGGVTAFIGRVIGGTTNSKTTTVNPGVPPRSTAPTGSKATPTAAPGTALTWRPRSRSGRRSPSPTLPTAAPPGWSTPPVTPSWRFLRSAAHRLDSPIRPVHRRVHLSLPWRRVRRANRAGPAGTTTRATTLNRGPRR